MNTKLIDYILEARRKGYPDATIRKLLLEHHWPLKDIDEAYFYINKETKKPLRTRTYSKEETKGKLKTFAYLDKKVIDALEKRARKNLFTLNEQIEDILRRSVASQKKKSTTITDSADDKLLAIFSRKKLANNR